MVGRIAYALQGAARSLLTRILMTSGAEISSVNVASTLRYAIQSAMRASSIEMETLAVEGAAIGARQAETGL
jgi:hypothetical protein